jgi:hypothetical protein
MVEATVLQTKQRINHEICEGLMTKLMPIRAGDAD